MAGAAVASTRDRSGTRSPALMLALATIGFAVNFWAWALISPLGPMFRDQGTLGDLTESDVALLVAVPVIVGSLGRILVGALTDRYGGRVMFPLDLGGDDRADPVHRLRRPGLLHPAAGRRLLPRHRRHGVRRRRPVRQRLVPAGAARPGDRHLRRRHGRHRDQRADHGQALHQRGGEGAVPDHRGRPGDLRRGRLAAAPGRARSRRPHDQPGGPAQRQRPAVDHLAGVHPLRGRLRRVRRLLRLPARLPQDRPRAHRRRRGEPDGRVRRGRRADAAGGRLALRPVRPGPGAVRRVRRRRRLRGDLGRHPAARRRRHGGLPGHGRRAGQRQRRHLRAHRPGDRPGPGRRRHRPGRRRRRSRRLRAAADHGLRLRPHRLLRHRPDPALGDRGPDPGAHPHRRPSNRGHAEGATT